MTLLCLAAIWLIGFGLVRWMFPQPAGWSLHNILLFSLGIGAGAGVVSCLYFLTLVLAGPAFTTFATVLGVAVVAALALALLAKKPSASLQWAEGPAVPWYLTALFVLAIALAVTMFVGAVVFNPHGEEGAWSIWNLKARFLFRGGASWHNAFASDLSWTHLDYPLLLPGLVALCWTLARHESVDAPIAIAFLFALGTAGVLAATLGVLRGKVLAFLAAIILLATASYIALSAALYGDVPLSFYILATIALLCLQSRYPENPRFTVLAGLMAGFGAWTRNEGILFVVALIAAQAITLAKAQNRAAFLPRLVRFVAGLAAPLAVVIFFKLRVAGPSDLQSVTPSVIWSHFADPGRWIVTLEGLLVALLTFGRFLLPILLAMALYWYLVRFQVDQRDTGVLATGAIALALTILAELLLDVLYVDNLALELGTSLERILLQVWPAALLLFFLASGPLELVASKTTARKAKASGRTTKHARPAPARGIAER